MSETAIGTSEIERRLFAKYHGPDFAILMDVRNGAGFQSDRSADALGIGLWPSRGCLVHGFEIKASRSDWLREVKEPAKADAFYRFCDLWCLVVGDPAIVKAGELPPTWGLLVPHGNSLREIVKPTQNPDVVPMPRSMLAAWIKRASQQAPLDEALKAAKAAGLKEGLERGRREAERVTPAIDPESAALITKFRVATGIDLHFTPDYRLAQIKQAMTMLHSPDTIKNGANLVQRQVADLRQLADRLQEAATALTTDASDVRKEIVNAA